MPIYSIVINQLVLSDDVCKGPYYTGFQQAILTEIEKINDLIQAYNQVSTQEERLELLDLLEKDVRLMDRKYPDTLKNLFPNYHAEIHTNLFEAIKSERALLSALPDEVNLSFQEYLAIMSPEKADQLLRILLEPDFRQEKLQLNLFAEGEAGRDVFMQILSNYEIEMFSGHNSKNFKVLDKRTSEVAILKVDNRLNTPKNAVDHLRSHSMNSVFTPDVSEREVQCINPADGQIVTRTLLFTEFHPAGDLKNDGMQVQHDEKTSSAINRYIQMATVLEKIEQDGCCFTDMKNGNWLVDDLGELRIADKKAFLFNREIEVDAFDDYGETIKKSIKVLDLNDSKNRYYSLPLSRQMSPPELETLNSTKLTIDVNKMHAYMLGKNLYQYLTDCKDISFILGTKDGKLTSIHHAEQLDFSSDVFQTQKGIALQHTIRQLINPDPNMRMTLHDTIEALAFIEYPDLLDFSFTHSELVVLKIDTYQLLKGLEKFKINSDDTQVTLYIDKQHKALMVADTEDSILNIHSEIAAMQYLLRENYDQFLAIKNLIKVFKADISPELAEKGHWIEEAVLSVPLIERSSIADGKTNHQQAVLNAMASKLTIKQPPSRAPCIRNTVEEYVAFKEKFAKSVLKPDDPASKNRMPNR